MKHTWIGLYNFIYKRICPKLLDLQSVTNILPSWGLIGYSLKHKGNKIVLRGMSPLRPWHCSSWKGHKPDEVVTLLARKTLEGGCSIGFGMYCIYSLLKTLNLLAILYLTMTYSFILLLRSSQSSLSFFIFYTQTVLSKDNLYFLMNILKSPFMIIIWLNS